MIVENLAANPHDGAEAFLAAGRTLMGMSIASVGAARVEVTMVQFRTLVLLDRYPTAWIGLMGLRRRNVRAEPILGGIPCTKSHVVASCRPRSPG